MYDRRDDRFYEGRHGGVGVFKRCCANSDQVVGAIVGHFNGMSPEGLLAAIAELDHPALGALELIVRRRIEQSTGHKLIVGRPSESTGRGRRETSKGVVQSLVEQSAMSSSFDLIESILRDHAGLSREKAQAMVDAAGG